MKVKVEMVLSTPATQSHKLSMRSAAKALTNNAKSINIYVSKKNERNITASFSMKNAAQYKVVDLIAREFRDSLHDYEDIAISF